MEQHPYSGKIIELLDHLGEEEMVLIPGVKVIERVHQHGVGVFVRSAFATVRLAYSPALRILSLLICPFPPNLQAIGLQMPLFFYISNISWCL